MMRGTRSDKGQAGSLGLAGGRRLGMMVPGAVFLFLFVLSSVPGAQDATETVFWESVVCEKAGEVEAYLETYPNGAYEAEAWACLEQGLGLDRAARILVQQGLAALDYPAGVTDGLFGPATRRAIQAWQAAKEFAATGYLTREQAETLLAQGRAAETEHQRQQETAARAEAERQRQETAAQRKRAEAERQRREAAARAEAERQRQEAATRADDVAYASAEETNNLEAYEAYLRDYPAGRHMQEAREQAELLRADKEDYEKAESENTIEAYEEYLRNYPAGRHISKARERIQPLVSIRERSAKDDWARATECNTIRGYSGYINRYKAGWRVAEAREARQTLRAEVQRLEQHGEDQRNQCETQLMRERNSYYVHHDACDHVTAPIDMQIRKIAGPIVSSGLGCRLSEKTW